MSDAGNDCLVSVNCADCPFQQMRIAPLTWRSSSMNFMALDFATKLPLCHGPVTFAQSTFLVFLVNVCVTHQAMTHYLL